MILCVTGPMASGKNAASSILEKKGFATVDADLLVHKVLEEEDTVRKIIDTFSATAAEHGITLLHPDNTIDRRALGHLVFSDPRLLAKQEAIVYPKIDRLVDQFIKKNVNCDIAVNATVLYKVPQLIKRCNAVLFIDAPAAIRFFRAKQRDHMKTVQILSRFGAQSQLFAKYKKSVADIKRIWNTGNLTALEHKIDMFLIKCRQRGL